MPFESRISDVVAAAGGFTINADQQALNLAQMVSDGQKVIVPHKNDAPAPVSSMPEPVKAEQAEFVNINIADAEMLSTLPGIGPAKANDIIAYRNSHGFFSSIDELMNVKGIGPANFEKIKSLITLY